MPIGEHRFKSLVEERLATGKASLEEWRVSSLCYFPLWLTALLQGWTEFWAHGGDEPDGGWLRADFVKDWEDGGRCVSCGGEFESQFDREVEHR